MSGGSPGEERLAEEAAAAAALDREIAELEAGVISDPPADLRAAQSANLKLKYRVAQLQRSIAIENSLTITERLSIVFTNAFRATFPSLPGDFQAKVVPSDKFADFQCNDALSIVADFKKQGVKSNPRQIAESVIKSIPSNSLISQVEVAGPGFINIAIQATFIHDFLKKVILDERVEPPVVEKKRVVVDFSSPNIAKEMHVGHLRSTIIGDSACRLLEWLGHDVVRLNHIGDWGTQFGMLIAHLEDMFPNYHTVSPPISDLQSFYKAAKKRFDEEEEFKKRAYQLVVRLQNFDPPIYNAWKLICDVSRKEFQEIYQRLNVRLIERGESFYQNLMINVVKDLKALDLLKEEDGRMIMFAKGSDVPLTVVKSDGGYTYDTSDLAAIRHRIVEERADWLIYVTDNGQSLHFQTIFSAAQAAGWLDPLNVRVQHIGFGVVLGEDRKKFKTRSGATVRLVDLLDEGLRRARDTLVEKGRHEELTEEELALARRAVAYGCVKYADISHNWNHDYVFSFDRMLDDKGNTAVYLLYALTRIRSIRRKAAGLSLGQLQQYISANTLQLDNKHERKLGRCLLGFSDVVKRVLVDMHLHYLCDFLYQLSTTFSEFYDNCYCIERSAESGDTVVHRHRLVLCEATAIVMQQVFDILGINTVSKM